MFDHSIAIDLGRPAARQPSDAGHSGTVELARLGHEAPGLKGKVAAIEAGSAELERSLLEMGLVEGARIEILHEGPFGRDPIAVRVDDMRVALRRKEAAAVVVRVEGRCVHG